MPFLMKLNSKLDFFWLYYTKYQNSRLQTLLKKFVINCFKLSNTNKREENKDYYLKKNYLYTILSKQNL